MSPGVMTPGPEDLLFLPLGGTGEIGMNLNLYGHDGAWLMIDLGITFSDPWLPGVDIIMPDPTFIADRRADLAGLVLTHAHEDHIGAVPHLWSRLRCPIYATAFTATVLRAKLVEAGLIDQVELIEVPLSGRFRIGPFEIELVTLTHSIPEPNAVVIRTSAGTVLHTGDWKLDPEPLIGEDYDEAALRGLADEGVLAMVCDSTNALVEGESGSEGEVLDNLGSLIGELPNRVAVACFATNVARLQTVMQVAASHGRRVALVGRSMHRIVAAARDNGYLSDLAPLISDKDVGYLPRNEVLLLCTGSQGEPRSALWRIARGEHPEILLEQGDAAVFSSRIIPGNEKSISALQNDLVLQGIKVITDRDHAIHVSGHPARDELTRMYQWVRPEVAIPVHGEPRHLAEHAELARACQVPESIVGHNGALIRLAPGRPRIVEEVPAGRLALDGERLVPADSKIFAGRRKLAQAGCALITVVTDRDGVPIDQPVLSFEGLIEDGEAATLEAAVSVQVVKALEGLKPAARKDDARLCEAARIAVRRGCFKTIGKKPLTKVHLIRLS